MSRILAEVPLLGTVGGCLLKDCNMLHSMSQIDSAELHPFLPSALDGCSVLLHAQAAKPPGKNPQYPEPVMMLWIRN